MSRIINTSAGSMAIVLAAAVSLGGCAAGSSYERPSVELPQHYLGYADQEKSSRWMLAEPTDTKLRGAWWEQFGDQNLNELEVQVEKSNQSIRKAFAQLEAARSIVRSAHAGYLPTVNASIGGGNNHTSANVAGKSLAGKTVPDYLVGMNMSWEADIWGRIRNTVDEATANSQASAADLEAVRLSVEAELAIDYFNVCALDAESELLHKIAAEYQTVRDTEQRRFDAGLVSALDLAATEDRLQQARAQESELEIARARYSNAIATLIGKPASEFRIETTGEHGNLPQIPVNVPSQLLQRRPDIAAAERRAAAANARIGIAHAAFFPNLMINGSVGLESTPVSEWLTAPSRVWALGPALIGAVFDGGRRQAAEDRANADYTSSIADYRQTVLSAIQQVEDSLVNLRILGQEAERLSISVVATRKTVDIGQRRHAEGLLSQADVALLEANTLTRQREMLDIKRRQYVATAELIKSLGGHW